MVSGPEFGYKAGNNMLVRNSRCGLKSFGTAFSSFLAETLGTMTYRPIYANPDLWLLPAVMLDGFE